MDAIQIAAEMTKQGRMTTIITDSETCRDMEQPRPRIAVVIAVRNTYKNNLRGVWKYHELVIHTNRGFNADPDVHPLIGLVVG